MVRKRGIERVLIARQVPELEGAAVAGASEKIIKSPPVAY